MQENNLAICIFGDTSDVLEKVQNCCIQKYKNFNISFFHVKDNNVFKSLWLTANEKRQNELLNNIDYDICLGLNIHHSHLIHYINIPAKLKDSSLYYCRGQYNASTITTSICPSGFYSNSFIFDLTSNFYLTKIQDQNLRNDTLWERFYFHLKYLQIKTKCIDYENSNLFKWAT